MAATHLATTPSTVLSQKDIIAILKRFAANSNRSASVPAECLNRKIAFCDDQPLYRQLMGNMFGVMLLLCLFGNCMNLIIYHSQQMRRFRAIQMLSAKALMNTLFMLCLLPQALRVSFDWTQNSTLDAFFWNSWPFQIYLVNVFGCCAMWLTVLMTVERYLNVVFPIESKIWCRQSNVDKAYRTIGGTALTLQLIYPINRVIQRFDCLNGSSVYQVVTRTGVIFWLYEKIYMWLNLLLVIVIPLTLLVFMSASIVWKLCVLGAANHHHYTVQKRCVTRITLVSTVLQLVCEMPAVPIFVLAALHGPSIVHNPVICVWQTGAHFMGLCNASLSFFVYLLCSERFRALVSAKLMACFEMFRHRHLYVGRQPLPIVDENHCDLLMNTAFSSLMLANNRHSLETDFSKHSFIDAGVSSSSEITK